MFALLPLALNYVTIPATPNASLMFRWTMPADFADESGLGGGLSYAMEPDFCAKMMGHFSDRDWITCGSINSAIHRAFESWAANHQA